MNARALCCGTLVYDISLFFFTLLVSVALLLASIPLSSHAGTSASDFEVFGSVLCRVYVILIGAPGKAVSCFAVSFTAIGALFGKMSWGIVIVVLVGVSGALGAHKIVGIIASSVGLDGDIGCFE